MSWLWAHLPQDAGVGPAAGPAGAGSFFLDATTIRSTLLHLVPYLLVLGVVLLVAGEVAGLSGRQAHIPPPSVGYFRRDPAAPPVRYFPRAVAPPHH